MQIKSKHLLTMLVMAGISASAISAKAATFTAGDLLLAFNQTSGSGTTTVLTLDLGNSSQFTTAAANHTNLTNIATLGSIINSTYGSAGLSTGDSHLFWAVVGDNTSGSTLPNGDPYKTAYITEAQTGTINAFGQTTTNFSSSSSTRNTYNSDVGSVISSFVAATGTTGPIAVNAGSTSWPSFASSGWGNGSITAQGNFTNGPSGTALDLYRVLGSGLGTNPSTYLGTFAIDSSGNVSFNTTVASAPEPSRTIFAALGLGALLLRRRRVNA